MLCLAVSSPALSQTNLSDSTCCVPCAAIRNALILKKDHQLLKAEIGVTRDSLNLITKQSVEKDSIIIDQKHIITEKDTIITTKDKVIQTKDEHISDLNHNIKGYKRQRNISYITSGGVFILTLLLLL
jgi:hypothetical protein